MLPSNGHTQLTPLSALLNTCPVLPVAAVVTGPFSQSPCLALLPVPVTGTINLLKRPSLWSPGPKSGYLPAGADKEPRPRLPQRPVCSWSKNGTPYPRPEVIPPLLPFGSFVAGPLLTTGGGCLPPSGPGTSSSMFSLTRMPLSARRPVTVPSLPGFRSSRMPGTATPGVASGLCGLIHGPLLPAYRTANAKQLSLCVWTRLRLGSTASLCLNLSASGRQRSSSRKKCKY